VSPEPSSLRILYLADIRFPLERANGIQTIQTCHALAERGHAVTLLVRPDTTTPARDPFVFYGVTPTAALHIARARVAGPALVRRALYLSAALARSLTSPRPDAVLTRDLGVAAALARIPRNRRPPLVYESHGYAPVVSALLPELLSSAPAASRAKTGRLERRERLAWERAEGYVTITRTLAHDLEARFGARPRMAVVADAAAIEPDRTFDWEGPDRPAWVTYAGHLYPWKGVDVLIEALTQLPDVRARIVGGLPGEPDLARLRALAASRGVEARVEFTGLVPPFEVRRWLQAADVLVLPNRATEISARYTSPLKLFEYLGAGRPIVASRLPALGEVLRDGENALLVEPDDPSALASAIARVSSDRALAVRLARCAFAAAAEFTWARRAERLEAVIEEARASR
jgi:glycosyltransferase involved in cell wall biosynthesis